MAFASRTFRSKVPYTINALYLRRQRERGGGKEKKTILECAGGEMGTRRISYSTMPVYNTMHSNAYVYR